jgi:hypothetical protein
MKTCSSCGVEQPLVNFSNRTTYCKPCAKRLKAIRTGKHKAIVQRYKVSCGCAHCGYKEHPEALCLSHKDRSTKWSNQKEYQGKSRSAILYCWSLDRIRKEVRKCEVLCMNCHTVDTIRKGDHL